MSATNLTPCPRCNILVSAPHLDSECLDHLRTWVVACKAEIQERDRTIGALVEALTELVDRRERVCRQVGGNPNGSDGRYTRARAAISTVLDACRPPPVPAASPGPLPLPRLVDGIARRCRTDLATPAESAIRKAVVAVEAVGADVRLTRAVVALTDAQAWVADFYEDVPEQDHYPRPVQSGAALGDETRGTP